MVRLLSDASAVPRLLRLPVEDEASGSCCGPRRAPYAALVGEIALERGEGLAWWAVERREPAFIRENALDDPRVKYVPELEEERFQSLVAVPIVGARRRPDRRDHPRTPRRRASSPTARSTSSSRRRRSSPARSRTRASTRRCALRVGELEHLTELAEAIAAAETLESCCPRSSRRSAQSARRRACHVYLLDAGRGGAAPPGRVRSAAGRARGRRSGSPSSGRSSARSRRAPRLAVPLVAGDELLGAAHRRADDRASTSLAPSRTRPRWRSRRSQVIERLTEKNLIKDFFEELAAGRPRGDLEGRAARLGCDLDRAPRRAASPSRPTTRWSGRSHGCAAARCSTAASESLRGARAACPSPASERLLERSAAPPRRLGGAACDRRLDASAWARPRFADGFEEARHALLGTAVLRREAGGDDLRGARRRTSTSCASRSTAASATPRSTPSRKLADYDRPRGASLLATLEEFLRRRGNISATVRGALRPPEHAPPAPAPDRRALRARPPQATTGSTIEIAVKMVKLQHALGTVKPHT